MIDCEENGYREQHLGCCKKCQKPRSSFKVAGFTRSVQRNDDWNEDTVKMAFAESVQGLPKKSKAKKKIQDSFELYWSY